MNLNEDREIMLPMFSSCIRRGTYPTACLTKLLLQMYRTKYRYRLQVPELRFIRTGVVISTTRARLQHGKLHGVLCYHLSFTERHAGAKCVVE